MHGGLAVRLHHRLLLRLAVRPLLVVAVLGEPQFLDQLLLLLRTAAGVPPVPHPLQLLLLLLEPRRLVAVQGVVVLCLRRVVAVLVVGAVRQRVRASGWALLQPADVFSSVHVAFQRLESARLVRLGRGGGRVSESTFGDPRLLQLRGLPGDGVMMSLLALSRNLVGHLRPLDQHLVGGVAPPRRTVRAGVGRVRVRGGRHCLCPAHHVLLRARRTRRTAWASGPRRTSRTRGTGDHLVAEQVAEQLVQLRALIERRWHRNLLRWHRVIVQVVLDHSTTATRHRGACVVVRASAVHLGRVAGGHQLSLMLLLLLQQLLLLRPVARVPGTSVTCAVINARLLICSRNSQTFHHNVVQNERVV